MREWNDEAWNTPITIWPSALADLKAWVAHALANAPRKIIDTTTPNVFMLVDACATGFGCVALDTRTGVTFAHGANWSDETVGKYGAQLQESVLAEPLAAIICKQWLLQRLDCSTPVVVAIGTDSVTAKAVLSRGYSFKSYRLNCLARLDRAAMAAFPERPLRLLARRRRQERTRRRPEPPHNRCKIPRKQQSRRTHH
jgi:hypothetical protein